MCVWWDGRKLGGAGGGHSFGLLNFVQSSAMFLRSQWWCDTSILKANIKVILCCFFSGNSSLPRSFEVFNDPDPFLTQPAHQFPNNAAVSCPVLPMQSSVIYSPPSSSAPSESSVASPMSSVDGWAINDDLSV